MSSGPCATSELRLDKHSTNSTVAEFIEVTLTSTFTLSVESNTLLKGGKKQLIDAEKADSSLAKCIAAVLSSHQVSTSQVA